MAQDHMDCFACCNVVHHFHLSALSVCRLSALQSVLQLCFSLHNCPCWFIYASLVDAMIIIILSQRFHFADPFVTLSLFVRALYLVSCWHLT